jgi:hypothetical protein
VATVALCVATSYAALDAHAQSQQLVLQAPIESAALLPEAPMPQTGDQAPAAAAATTQTTTPAAPAGSSSSTPPDPSAATQTPTAADLKKQQHDQAERDLKVQEKQRLLGVMPQFQVVMGGQAVPLSAGQKFKLALHSAIDPFYIGWAFVIGGGYGELVGNDNGYGWATGGYFKRVGANYADNVNGALIGNAVLPSILHQDPRYFRKGTGPIFKRFLYAAQSTVVCKGDNGKWQPNVSNVLGNFISGAISNSYYPANERGVSLTLENGLSVTLFGALGGQVLEFGPDLARLVHRNKKVPAASPIDPAQAAPAANVPPSNSPTAH